MPGADPVYEREFVEGPATLLGGVLANVEGLVAPATFVEPGVDEELNGLLLCQGHFVPAQPEAMSAKAIMQTHWDKELRIIRESFATGQERSPFVRRPPVNCPKRPESSMNPVSHHNSKALSIGSYRPARRVYPFSAKSAV
jgi:hypothetical protein